jgi:2-oxo-4-hydroxy-4-carboxy-5-ureidoimidazoline decarboxylase
VQNDAIKKRLTLGELNQMPPEEFISVVGPVFEKSAWIATAAEPRRPFASIKQALEVLQQTVRNATAQQKLNLICAHPDLVGRAALAGTLTPESTREQSSAGLGQLSAEEIEIFRANNAAYHAKFGFPFVICARLNKKDAILAGFKNRLSHSHEQEIETALAEIFKIADLRFRDIVEDAPTAKLSTHVLDTTRGCPASGMRIELWLLDGESPRCLKTVEANADGRTDAALLSGDEVRDGQYELIFCVGDYFRGVSPERFLDRVPVRFRLKSGARYHIPLLCSPWAYSTYRGS